MNVEKVFAEAMTNLVRLGKNPYPGRGLVLGTSQDGLSAVQIYWIMGRSENSRNRIFKFEGGRLYTEAFDPSKVKDPRLIIYNAMAECNDWYVVSNGDQTDTVVDAYESDAGATLGSALCVRRFEPDEPNFTPRITGVSVVVSGKCFTALSLLRRTELVEEEAGRCARSYYEYDRVSPGFGFCLTTYNGDGNPLPSFTGDPYPLPIDGEIDEVLGTYWTALNPENRVALAVKFIDITTGISQIKVVNQLTK